MGKSARSECSLWVRGWFDIPTLWWWEKWMWNEYIGQRRLDEAVRNPKLLHSLAACEVRICVPSYHKCSLEWKRGRLRWSLHLLICKEWAWGSSSLCYSLGHPVDTPSTTRKDRMRGTNRGITLTSLFCITELQLIHINKYCIAILA